MKYHDPPISIPSRDEEYSLQYFSPLVLRAVSVALSFERSKKHADWLRRHNSVAARDQYIMACSLGTDVYSRIAWLKKYMFIRLNTEEVRVHAVPPTAMCSREANRGSSPGPDGTLYADDCSYLSRVEEERTPR